MMIRRIGLMMAGLGAGAWLLYKSQVRTMRVDVQVDLPERGFSHARFGAVLARFVDDEGRVDYAELRRERLDLEVYLAQLAKASPEATPSRFEGRAAELAYYLNAYNAFMMYQVTERPGLRSVNDKPIRIFGLTKFIMGGRPVTLHALENEIVRPMGEPRIHFALNCASMGCPTLPRAAVEADALEAQLAVATRAFCRDSRHVQRDGERVRLSQIFEWYAEDFEASGGPLAFCRAWGREDLPEGAAVEHLPYDWSLNAQQAEGG